MSNLLLDAPSEKSVTVEEFNSWTEEKKAFYRAQENARLDKWIIECEARDAEIALIPWEEPPEPVPVMICKFDFDPCDLPGLIGDTVRWIVKTAIQPQPMLALLNVIGFCGSVFGRRYASPLDTRTNIYIVGVAETGSGKDSSRKMIKKLAEAAGLSQFIGGDAVRSDTGMVRDLSINCSQLLMLDEFGKFLQALTDKNASGYHKAIIKVLMSLYSDSGSVYNHGAYADARNKTITIQRPNLCIYGTTTEGEYIKGLHRDAVLSGELNRVIAIKVDNVAARRVTDLPVMDNELVKEWARHSTSSALINLAGTPPEPKIVSWGDCDDLQWSIRQEQDKVGGDPANKALWNRRHENIIKIAMILAIARDKDYPRFETEDFDIARQIVDASIHYMASLVSDNMADTPYESDQQRIKAYLKKHDGVTQSQLGVKFKSIKARDRRELLADMIEQGEIVVELIPGVTKATRVYKAA